MNTVLGQIEIEKTNHLFIGMTPLNLIEPITPTLEFAAEVQIDNRLALEAKYGFQFEKFSFFGKNGRLNEKYFEAKFALKYKLRSKRSRRGSSSYIGLEYFLVSHKYDKSNSWLIKDGTAFAYSAATINRLVNGLRVKIEIMFFENNNWLISFYTGLGVRQITLDYDTVGESAMFSIPFTEFEWFSDRKVGVEIKPDFIFGFKISYRIFKW